jgi:tetratricopeptide (TPR) repeat protein
LDDTFSIPFRNLGIAEFNVLHNAEAAALMYERAFALAPHDARILYELDQLKKRAALCISAERLKSLDEHKELVTHRDDLTVEYITLLNQLEKWNAALEHLNSRQFNPWEGGEGMVSGQYVHAHRALALCALLKADAADALKHLEAARHYPQNLGEGKHLLTEERDLDYFSGLAALEAGDKGKAEQFFSAAAATLATPSAQAYFQATALRELGREDAARDVLAHLKAHADKLLATKPVIDYFATSLPNLLLFDDDLDKRNQVHALLLSGLANDGLGRSEEAREQLEHVLAADPNHLFAAEMLRWFRIRGERVRHGSLTT